MKSNKNHHNLQNGLSFSRTSLRATIGPQMQRRNRIEYVHVLKISYKCIFNDFFFAF